MSYIVGDVFYCATVWEGRVEIEKWVVKTIRANTVYLVAQNNVTWGKLSSKIGDYGWLPGIPSYYRDNFLLEEPLPGRYGKSETAAIRARIKNEKKSLARHSDAEVRNEIEATIAVLERSLKQRMGRSKNLLKRKKGSENG